MGCESTTAEFVRIGESRYALLRGETVKIVTQMNFADLRGVRDITLVDGAPWCDLSARLTALCQWFPEVDLFGLGIDDSAFRALRHFAAVNFNDQNPAVRTAALRLSGLLDDAQHDYDGWIADTHYQRNEPTAAQDRVEHDREIAESADLYYGAIQ